MLRRLVLALSGVVLVSAPVSSGSALRSLASPSRGDIALGIVHDSTLRAGIDRNGFWGGTYTTDTNERVTIYSSRSYAVDDAANQRWANFFASLVHGSELGSVTVYLAPPAQVASLCGGIDILGCYGHGDLVAPGEDTPDIAAEAVMTHEYGHHVAAHRSNAPWRAIAWGTKRWASYFQVCRRTRAKELFPGAEAALVYKFNPGEVFAETYRVLNEQKAGLQVTPWNVVDWSLQPDARGLALLEQDVLDPWTSNTTVTLKGTFGRRGSSTRVFKVATPYDGTLTTSLAPVDGEQLRVNIGATTVCGARTTTLRVTRIAGSGAFTLNVSRP